MAKIKRKPKKMRFYYKINKTIKQGSGRKQTAILYKMTANGLVKVGTTSWNTAGYKGKKASVIDALLEKKALPKSRIKSTDGYYTYHDEEHGNFKVEEI